MALMVRLFAEGLVDIVLISGNDIGVVKGVEIFDSLTKKLVGELFY